VPRGSFRLSQTLELGDGPIVLEGDGGWSTRGATTLRFDAGVTGVGALGITLLTVSFHAVKAATANPVHSLRSE
jgi:hypothetical protein